MDASIDTVAWAIQNPALKLETRPARLIREMLVYGLVSSSPGYRFHGRGGSSEGNENKGRWYPKVQAKVGAQASLAVLSPVFQDWSQDEVVWADFYDDWSIAPDINVWHRFLASRTYSRIARGKVASVIVTCNTPYMAAKLGLGAESVVPNGVDLSFAHLQAGGDDRRRLIILGHLFKGRTDLELLRAALVDWPFEDIVIGAPGTDGSVLGIIEEALSQGRPVRSFAWLSPEELASMSGPRTVGLVPHVVTDYTLSQDLMKVYQFLALGIKVVCPRLLWPSAIDDSLGFLYGIGSDPGAIDDWNGAVPISAAERVEFAVSHSWQARARRIAQLIGQGSYA